MNVAVIFAGGTGRRMGGTDVPKQFLVAHGRPIIVRTLDVFERCGDVDAVFVSCVAGWRGALRGMLDEFGISKVRGIADGGATGMLSIRSGLLAASEYAGPGRHVALIHDGVRPLIDEALVSACVASVREYGSAVTCVEAKETVVAIGPGGEVTSVPERPSVRLARAPQGFWLDEVLAAQDAAMAEGRDDVVDTATLMHAAGHRLRLVPGPDENIKVTTPDDFYLLQGLLGAREGRQIYG